MATCDTCHTPVRPKSYRVVCDLCDGGKASLLIALCDAQECLREYHTYGEAMREHGRGFHPVAKDGASIKTVQARIAASITMVEGKP